MKASVAFVLLAFLSATTAKVHVQNRRASKVIEDPDEANNFLKRASVCLTCPLTGVRCCLPSVCRPTDGKCSSNPTEVARETGKSVLERANEVKKAAQEQVREQVSERGREVRERTEEAREKLTGWR
ncbi:uncharacterized protein [Porites lutea]|uniref:uncharacterized protein n=1 Tax=Porites lutea TaxID=51062 RepID=UPI003CC58C52